MRESNTGRKVNKESSVDTSETETRIDSDIESCLFDSSEQHPTPSWDDHVKPFRIFVATWNVAGKPPHNGLDLDEFLQVHDEWDLYILGFQEIVPLNVRNVLVVKDNEPAVNWLDLINQSLNQSDSTKSTTSSLFFKKASLRKFSRKFRTGSKRWLETCNCSTIEFEKNLSTDNESCFRCLQSSTLTKDDDGLVEDSSIMKYSLVVSKQMVGIFVTIWMKKDLVTHVRHLRVLSTGRGIMGYLGDKGCISVSMSFHRTSLCFICSHLASGERERDKLKRNSDVVEILENTKFRKICKIPNNRGPDKISEHDRIIWLGDLNYRVGLSYSEARRLLETNDWDSLLDKDQLKVEREAGGVFQGFQEGKICFAPTYKYSCNSDTYVGGEAIKTRRTPAWCDRILWQGNGIRQLSYIRGESQFSDHRPVCATFFVDVFGNL